MCLESACKQSHGDKQECHHRQCAIVSCNPVAGSLSKKNPVAGCEYLNWEGTCWMQLDLGIAIFFYSNLGRQQACNLQGQGQGHPLFWFDETRSPYGPVSSVHVGRQARTATGHGHLQGYTDVVG